MGHVNEAVFSRHPFSPLLDLGTLHLDRTTAGLTHEVMVMMFGTATTVAGLTVVAA